MRSLLLDFLAFALVLTAPWVVLLGYHGYAFFTPEVLLIVTAVLAIAAIMAIASALTGALARTVLLAILLALFIDLHVALPRLPSLVLALIFLAAVAALSALLWLVREHATKIVSVIFITLIALTVLTANPKFQGITNETGTAATRASDAPLLIHLILDEHIGVEGLPPEIADAQQLRTELIDFYAARGFRLFGGAYSQYANTFNAIANLLNFAARDVSHPFLTKARAADEWDLKESAYFRMLEQRGYQLHLYQSTYVDLCHTKDVHPRNCLTYPVSSLDLIQHLQLRPAEKARFIVAALLSRSLTLRAASKAYQRIVLEPLARLGVHAPEWRPESPSFGPLPIPEVLQRLTADIIAHPRGHAFFAHLMLPHYPYVFDEHCALRPRTADWLTNHITSPYSLVYNTAESRAQKYQHYAAQVRCTLRMLDEFFDALDNSGLLVDATVVVNGDHGSRIPAHFPSGSTLAGGVLTEADYRDTFSTLYAIRAPGVTPAYVQQPASLVNLLDHYLGREPLREENSCRVFLINGAAGPVLTTVEPRFCARQVTGQAITEQPAGDHD
jgi:hypothetical protein